MQLATSSPARAPPTACTPRFMRGGGGGCSARPTAHAATGSGRRQRRRREGTTTSKCTGSPSSSARAPLSASAGVCVGERDGEHRRSVSFGEHAATLRLSDAGAVTVDIWRAGGKENAAYRRQQRRTPS